MEHLLAPEVPRSHGGLLADQKVTSMPCSQQRKGSSTHRANRKLIRVPSFSGQQQASRCKLANREAIKMKVNLRHVPRLPGQHYPASLSRSPSPQASHPLGWIVVRQTPVRPAVHSSRRRAGCRGLAGSSRGWGGRRRRLAGRRGGRGGRGGLARRRHLGKSTQRGRLGAGLALGVGHGRRLRSSGAGRCGCRGGGHSWGGGSGCRGGGRSAGGRRVGQPSHVNALHESRDVDRDATGRLLAAEGAVIQQPGGACSRALGQECTPLTVVALVLPAHPL